MKKRLKAADLVKNSVGQRVTGVNWYQQLSSESQDYINEVVKELIANPNAALCIVAEQLIDELEIQRHPDTITRTLKEMIKKHG